MPFIEPVQWQFGKRLMPHLLPCSAVILFVRIAEFCFNFYFPILESSFRSLPQEVYLRITMASSRGERQGFQDDFSPMLQKLAETKPDLAHRSRMPNFAP